MIRRREKTVECRDVRVRVWKYQCALYLVPRPMFGMQPRLIDRLQTTGRHGFIGLSNGDTK